MNGHNGHTGVVIATVCSLDDPENLGRVKLTIPTLENQETDWARLAAPGAGKERGFFSRPEVGDEVVVAFEHNDPKRAYVVGQLWNTEDKPPKELGKNTDNNLRAWVSRSGHRIRLDDTQGAEKIEIIEKDSKCCIVIDTKNNKIQVTADTGDIEVTAQSGKITIKAKTVDIEATSDLTLKGATVDLEATGSMTIKGATVDFEASGNMTIKGAMVNIN